MTDVKTSVLLDEHNFLFLLEWNSHMLQENVHQTGSDGRNAVTGQKGQRRKGQGKRSMDPCSVNPVKEGMGSGLEERQPRREKKKGGRNK